MALGYGVHEREKKEKEKKFGSHVSVSEQRSVAREAPNTRRSSAGATQLQ